LGGKVGVFTMKRLVYRPAAGLLAFPDGGLPRYLTDRNLLASYDFASGTVRILHEENARRQAWLPGSSSFHVVAAFGPKVIVRTSGQIKGDYSSRSETWVYDLDQEARSELPLEAELAARGRALGYFYLTDADGTLVIVANDLDDKASRREKRQFLLVRHPDGLYQEVGALGDYYGLRGGELFYWAPEQRLVAVDLASGNRRTADRREALGLSSDPKAGEPNNPTLGIDQGLRSILTVGRRSDGGWVYQPLPFSVAELAGD
jgi:hypothetical protein